MNTCWRGILIGLCFASMATAQVWVQEVAPDITTIWELVATRRGECLVSGVTSSESNAPTAFLKRFSVNGNLAYTEETLHPILLATVGNRVIGVESNNVFQIRENGARRPMLNMQGPASEVRRISGCDNHSFIVAGWFQEQLTVGKRTLVAQDPEALTGFAARVGVSGRLLWLTELPFYWLSGVGGTRTGGAYVLGPGLTVQAIDSRGRLTWLRNIPGDYTAASVAIAADRTGGCYVTGLFLGSMRAGTSDLQTRGTQRQAVVCALTPNGDVVSGWTVDAYSAPWDLAVDPAGNWSVAIMFAGSAGTWPYSQTENLDGIVVKNGDFYSAASLSGPGSDAPQRIATGRDGSLYLAGFSDGGGPLIVGSATMTNGGAVLAKFKLP